MSSLRYFSLSFFCTALLARAQTAAPPPGSSSPGPSHSVERLGAFVVTAGPDPKTAFDLAQGSAVLAGDALRKLAQSTLGETLASVPGVASTYYGPGASRPVIRGLGGDRIRILDNGIGAFDASNVSPDHNTTLEPLFASRIEVLRGPSTLLYGSSAVGGVVNVIDSTIPERAPEGGTTGEFELRAGGAARERSAALSVGSGTKQYAVHVNALGRQTRDLRIAGVPRIDVEAPADQARGRLPDSATKTSSFAGGASVFGTAGRVGVGVTRYETTYGVPSDDGGISIDMHQTRLDLSADIIRPFGPFRSAKMRVGYGDYRHAELTDGSITNTAFSNRAWEGRVELLHVPLGKITGTVGLQATYTDFAAKGEEVVTPPFTTETMAVFAVEELKLNERLTLQFGGRLEGQTIHVGDVDPDLPPVPGYRARSGQNRRFAGGSGSTGLVFQPTKEWSIGASVAVTSRLPTAQELFSNGPHGGTRAYEVGTTSLGNERSVAVDLNVRRRIGIVTGSIGGFVNRFRHYIFEEELPLGAIPPSRNPSGHTPYQFVARDAVFRGAEAEVTVHLLDREPRHLHLELTSDYVRAEEEASNRPLPRIPPLRFGARLNYEDGRWRADVGFQHARAQRRVAANESLTGDYTLLNANLAYVIPTPRVIYEVFLSGRNLGDADAREHTSFLKEFAPLPGRGVVAGLRLSF